MGALPYKINRIFNRWEPYHANKVKPCLLHGFFIRQRGDSTYALGFILC